MPPRIAPGHGAGPRRGGPNTRGIGAARGGVPVAIAAHVKTVGVKRPGYGTGGRPVDVIVNAFEVRIPDCIIYHYDVVVHSEKLPARVNMELFNKLQMEVARNVFTPEVYDGIRLEEKDRVFRPAVYDGRKNAFTRYPLALGANDSAKFEVTMKREGPPSKDARPPKVYTIKLTKVAEINTEILHRFINGQSTQDSEIQTAITAFNVVTRMGPNLTFPFNVRSFFTPRDKRGIGGGLELWRGYFQSIRPSQGRMYLNLDISTGVMYKEGSLILLCLEFLDDLLKPGPKDPKRLSPGSLHDRDRIALQHFLSALRVSTSLGGRTRIRPIQKLTAEGANAVMFTMRQGGPRISVAHYCRTELNMPLKYPEIICVEFASGAKIPLELCTVPGGQFMRDQIPANKTAAVIDFSKLRPEDRLASIRQGLQVLNHGQSDYVQKFGMAVNSEPIVVRARVLGAPVLRYGQGSKQPTVQPSNGQWNMLDKKFHTPKSIKSWIIVVYATDGQFGDSAAEEMAKAFCEGAKSIGMMIEDLKPQLFRRNPHKNIIEGLNNAYIDSQRAKKQPPSLIVVILPEGGNHIYTAVKHFGDIQVGVATQCLISRKCARAKPQYWANVMLKVNVKLGGINTILDSSILNDIANPTIIMGADVKHPAPRTQGQSYVGVVSSIDITTAKYIPTSRVQTGRQEIISDLEAMVYELLKTGYLKDKAKKAPGRLIFYRDGVSEAQFQHVLDHELPMIKRACKSAGINPKITLIIVGKRHHIRMFPLSPRDGDKSGNCKAGTTIDRGLGHPTEFDYYQLSHGGLLGTSRPAHYSVIYDESEFSVDTMQNISFALAHVYARSTRSVSLPAPVAYAHIVCGNAKRHYAPGGEDFSDTATQASPSAETQLEAHKKAYKPLHPNQASVMSFM